ncbi:MAG TPA: malto-oligosyltrehalose trehalohydrolase [Vicinamibacteria bacterium]|nr:malto-oligosyltrehalose trehalohydrolase [Vicinamibacteria bacterium]
MTLMEVWAPAAGRVEAEVDGRRLGLSRQDGGWWRGEASWAGPGADYGFRLDDDDRLLPDPRSPWQPAGVHGPSRLVDHPAFAWTDGAWQPPPLGSALFYELHVGTFTAGGTFDSAVERLDHLRELGVTHVELMPVNQFPGARGWGYDGVGLFAPQNTYGGPEGLKRLVEACHARGLAVVLDVVYNHLGPSGNYLGRFGPYFSDRHRTPWGPAVNLDGAGSHEVRRFFGDNARHWFRHYHVDGLRLDAVHAFVDTSAVHFLEQLADEVDRLEADLGRHLLLVAESDLNDPRVVRERAGGGYGIDAQWNDDFHHALHVALTGERDGYYGDYRGLGDLAKALRDAFVYDGRFSPSRDRVHGRSALGLESRRFLAYLQNHDQVGNRARGDRSAHLVSTGRLAVAAAIVLFSPFVPMLFQGEEWGARTPFPYFTDHEDADLAASISHGRKEEFAAFGWRPEDVPDPQDPATFERARLDWSEKDREPHRRLLAWHHRLVALRRRHPALGATGRLGETAVRCDEAARWLVVGRGDACLVANLGDAQKVPLGGATTGRLLLASEAAIRPPEDDALELPADSVAILAR